MVGFGDSTIGREKDMIERCPVPLLLQYLYVSHLKISTIVKCFYLMYNLNCIGGTWYKYQQIQCVLGNIINCTWHCL